MRLNTKSTIHIMTTAMLMVAAMVEVIISKMKLKSNMRLKLSQIGEAGKVGVKETILGKFHGSAGTNKECKNMTCISKTSNVTPKVKFGVMEVTLMVLSTFLVNVTGLIPDSLSTNNTMEL